MAEKCSVPACTDDAAVSVTLAAGLPHPTLPYLCARHLLAKKELRDLGDVTFHRLGGGT